MQSPTLSPKRFAEAFAKKHPAPHAPREPKQEIFHGQTVEDNYTTLQRQSPESDAWLNAQEKRLQAYNAASPHHEEHIEILKESFNYVKESRPIFAGGKYFSILDDGQKQRSTVIVRDSLDGEPTTLIDPSEWDQDNPSTKFFHITNIKPSADGSRIIVSYSNAGLAPFAAILDVESKSYIESHKSDRDMKWMPGSNDTIIYGDWHEEEKHWCLRKHTINDSPDQDRTVFEFSSPERKHAAHLFIGSDKGKATHEFLALRFGGSKDNGLYTRHLGEEGSFDLLFDDGKSKALPIGEVDGKLLVYTDHDAPMGRVVAVDYANPSPDNWETVIAENSEHDLERVSLVRGKLVAHYLENAQTRISLFEKDGRYIDDIPLPEGCTANLCGLGPHENRLLLLVDSFMHPKQRYFYDIKTNELTPWNDGLERPSLSDDFIVEKLYATSKDGTKVPMSVVRHKDVKLDGSAAVVLNGYGGFDKPRTPSFHANMYHFLQQGGIFVQANLRGGGEFGKEWYEQGKQRNKQNVFDDFAACAETLIEKNYTQPDRLAAHGASHGGLVVLATLLQRPELFGCVIAHAARTDMLDKQAKPWEYGDPRTSLKDFKATQAYSPLHNIQKNKKYPPTLVCTATGDKNVPSHHGKNFVATMNEKSPESLCLLMYEQYAGHYANALKSRDQLLNYHATMYDFLEQSLGPINQEEYKTAAKEWEQQENQSTEIEGKSDKDETLPPVPTSAKAAGSENSPQNTQEQAAKGEQVQVGIGVTATTIGAGAVAIGTSAEILLGKHREKPQEPEEKSKISWTTRTSGSASVNGIEI